MASPANSNSSANFYRFAAVCGALYVIAQIIQQSAFRYGINDSAAGEQGILQRLMPLDQLRLTAILLSFFPVTAAFGAVALRRAKVRPAASLLGFAFALLFVITEVSSRSIDLFLVSRRWAVEYQAAPTEAVKQMIAGKVESWGSMLGAFYFVLLAGHLLASVSFAIATWDREDRWNQAVAVAFIVNCVRLAGRIAEGYMGQRWLEPVNTGVYFPAVVLIFSTIALWLWRQARQVQQENM